MSNRTLSGPILLSEAFVHHYLIRLLARIGEDGALREPDPHALEVAGLDAVVSDEARRTAWRRGLPFELQRPDHEVLHWRRAFSQHHRLHAGDSTGTRGNFCVERVSSGGRGVRLFRQHHRDSIQTLGLESRVPGLELHDAADEERRADE